MKKSFLTSSLLVLVSSILFLTTSCENFTTGSEIQDEITAKIQYENSPRFSVSVAPDQSKYGVVTTTNSKNDCRVTDSMNIGFTSSTDYFFTHWIVRVGNTLDSGEKYVKILNSNSADTTITFLKEPPAGSVIQLVPVCELRPTISSIKPDTEDEFRDAPVKVRFTQSMNKFSIYYKPEEIAALSDVSEFLTENGNTYGYIKNGVTYFKNISITNDETGESILNHYKMPYIEGGKTLVVPAKSSSEAPKAGSGISVEISNNFYYTKNGYDIPLLSSRTGYYGTNTSIDNIPPTLTIEAPALADDGAKGFTPLADSVRAYGAKLGYDTNRNSDVITSIKSLYGNAGGNPLLTNTEPLVSSNEYLDKTHLDEATALKSYVRDRKIYLKALINDTGSKPDFFGMKIERLDSYLSGPADYPELVKLPLSISGNNGLFTDADNTNYAGIVDFTNTSVYPDGVYKVIFVARDKNGNTAYDVTDTNYRSDVENLNTYGKYYYFVFDNNTPTLAFPSFGTNDTDLSIIWTIPPSTLDYKNVVIQYKKESETDFSAPIPGITSTTKVMYLGRTGTNTPTNSYSNTTMETGVFYNIKIYASDWYGNDSNAYIIKKTTAPKPINVDLVSGNAYTGTSVTLNWEKPASGNYSGTIVYYNTTNSTTGALTKSAPATEGTQSCTITGLTTGTTYYILPRPYISYHDGVKSSWTAHCYNATQDRKIDVNPAAVTNFNVTVNSATQATLSWTNPTGNYTGIKVYKKLKSAADYDLVESITDKTSSSYAVTGLTPGNEYDFKVTAYATLQQERTAESPVLTKIMLPDTPTNAQVVLNSTDPTTKHDISWTASSGIITGYKVYVETSNGTPAKGALVATVPADTTSATISGLQPGKKYSYKVVSYLDTASGTTLTSPSSSITSEIYARPNCYTINSISEVSSATSSITIGLKIPSGSITGYAVYYKKSSDPDSAYTYYNTGNTKSYTISSLLAGTSYDIKLVSYVGTFSQTDYEADTSTNTNVNSFADLTYSTRPDIASNIKLTETTTTSATVGWTNPTTTYTGVKVYKKLSTDTDYTLVEAITDGSTSSTITGLSAGGNYTFKVQTYVSAAVKAPAISVDTNEDLDSTRFGSVTTNIRPNSVTNVTIAPNTSNPTTKADVSWTFPTEGIVNGVNILYSTKSVLDNDAVYGAEVNNSTDTTTRTLPSSGNLSPGEKYYVWVVTYAGSFPSSSTIKAGTTFNWNAGTPVEVITKPAAVPNLTVTSTTQNSVTLSWDSPSGTASGFTIYKKDITAGETTYTKVESTTSRSYTVPSLKTGHKYQFAVRTYSYDQSNESADSTITQYTRPSSITTSASVKSNSKITYNWSWPVADSDGSQGVTGLVVMYGTSSSISGASYKTWWKPSETERSDDITGLSPNTNYYVWIYTYVGDSTMGNIASSLATELKNGTTRLDVNCELNGVKVKTAPNAPTNLTGTTVAAGGQIKLTWTAPTGDCDGYKLYYGTSSSSLSSYISISSSYTSYTFIGTPNTNYYFKLYSYSDTWISTTSSNVSSTSVTGPIYERYMYPTDITAEGDNTGKVTLSWINPGSYPYIGVFYSTTNDISKATYASSVGWLNGTSTTCTLNNLSANKRYYIWLASLGSGKNTTDVTGRKDGTNAPTSPYVVYTHQLTTPRVDYVYDKKFIPNWINPATYEASGYVFKYKDLTAEATTYKKIKYTISTAVRSYSISDSTLVPGHKYEVIAGLYYSNGYEHYSSTPVTFYLKPSAFSDFLTSFTATTGSSSKELNLAWAWSSSVTGRGDAYILIYYSTSNNFSTATYIDYWNPKHNTSKTYTMPASNTRYYLWPVLYAGELENRPMTVEDVNANAAATFVPNAPYCYTTGISK